MATNIELYKGLKITDPPPNRDGGELIIDNFKYIADNLEILNGDYVSKSNVTQIIDGKKTFSDLNVNYINANELLATDSSGKIVSSNIAVSNIVYRTYVDNATAALDERITNLEETYITEAESSDISGYLQYQIDAIVLSGGVSNFLQLTDSPNSYVGSEGKAVLVKMDQSGLEFAEVGDPYLRTEMVNITGDLTDRITSIEINYTTRTETADVSAYLQNQINAVPLSAYTTRTETADVSAYLQNQINSIEQESTIVLGGNGIEVLESISNVYTVSVSSEYVLFTELQTLSGGLVTLQNAYNNGNIINLYDARSFVINSSGGSNGLTVYGNGNVTTDGLLTVNNSAYISDELVVDDALSVAQTDQGSVNNNYIYYYNSTLLGAVTNDTIVYESNVLADEIHARASQSYENVIKTRQVFYGTVINSPISGQSKFDDYVIYNDQYGNLKFDKCNYSSTTTRESMRDYENILTLFGPTLTSTPGYYNFSNILGPFGRRLRDSKNYRNWTLSSGSLTGEDRDYLRVEPPDSPFTQGYYNCGIKGDSSQRGVGVYTTGGGVQADILFDVYIPNTGEFLLDCDVVATWNRFAASEELRYGGFEFRISGSGIAQYARVDNTGVSISQARTWLTDTTAPSSAKSHFSYTWFGLTPGVHTVTVKYNNTASSIIPPPSGMTRGTNMRNTNVAIYNLLTNSEYPLDPTSEYRGIKTPNVYVSTLTAGPSGNFLTWNGDGRIIDGGKSISILDTFSTISAVSNISGYLQDQINSVNVLGGNGIQVIESPTNTFTVAVSSDYALTSYVNSTSANSYTQSINYVNNLLPRSYVNDVISTSVIDSVAASATNSANWTVSVSGSTGLRTSNILAITDGSTVEYAESSTPSIGDTSNLDLISDINAGYLRLVALSMAGSWNVKAIRVSP
jgi:hypothetical protein